MNAQTAPTGMSAKTDVDSILSLLAAQLGGTRLRDAQTFAAEFLRRLPAEDLAARSPAQWAGTVQGALEFARERRPGAAKVRVFNPGEGGGARGAVSTRTVDKNANEQNHFVTNSGSGRAQQ